MNIKILLKECLFYAWKIWYYIQSIIRFIALFSRVENALFVFTEDKVMSLIFPAEKYQYLLKVNIGNL